MIDIEVNRKIASILVSFKYKKLIQNKEIIKKKKWILDFILKVNFFKP